MARKPLIGVRLDPDIADGMRRAAERRQRSMSFMVNRACRQFLDREVLKADDDSNKPPEEEDDGC